MKLQVLPSFHIMAHSKQHTSSLLLVRHSCVPRLNCFLRNSLCGKCGHSLGEWCRVHQQQLHMLDHRKPVQDQALCQKRHIPVEGNVDQVSNPVLENNMVIETIFSVNWVFLARSSSICACCFISFSLRALVCCSNSANILVLITCDYWCSI